MRAVFTRAVLAGVVLAFVAASAMAQPEGFQGVVAREKDEVLYQYRPTGGTVALPKKLKLLPMDDLQFTGPRPSHPFVLGSFAVDGKWGLQDGYLQVVQGKNAALELAWADQFELEGTMEQQGFGGWFFLMGWDQGRGYALHNVTMKESGSPWFLSEFRGNRAIDGKTLEFDKFEWKGAQPFKLSVSDNVLSLEVGKFRVLDQVPLEGYSAGGLALGIYDTRYGPRPLRVHSLRIRALPAAMAPEEPVEEN